MSLQINENSSSNDGCIENDEALESAVTHDESSITNHKQNENLPETDEKIDATALELHEEETAASSNTTEPTEKYDLNIFLGRWVLVDSQVSTPLVKVIRAEMIMTPLGDDEYTINDTWTESICWCYRRTYKTTSIGRGTGPDTFIETNVKTGKVEYGRMEGNKHIVVGDQVITHEFVGDKCYMKIVDPSCSLYIAAEYQRIPMEESPQVPKKERFNLRDYSL